MIEVYYKKGGPDPVLSSLRGVSLETVSIPIIFIFRIDNIKLIEKEKRKG